MPRILARMEAMLAKRQLSGCALSFSSLRLFNLFMKVRSGEHQLWHDSSQQLPSLAAGEIRIILVLPRQMMNNEWNAAWYLI